MQKYKAKEMISSFTRDLSVNWTDKKGGGGGGGSVLIDLACWPSSLQSFLLFLPPGPSPRSATEI